MLKVREAALSKELQALERVLLGMYLLNRKSAQVNEGTMKFVSLRLALDKYADATEDPTSNS